MVKEISTNKNLEELKDVVNGINAIESVNPDLEKINYVDNQIKMNNELLQLKANKYNKDSIEIADLDEGIMMSNELLRKRNRKLRMKNALINFGKKIILILFLFGIPASLFFLGYVSQKAFLILVCFAICVFYFYIKFGGDKINSNDLLVDDSHLNGVHKINNFKFRNGIGVDNVDFSGSSVEDSEDYYSGINEELIKKCCNEGEDKVEVDVVDLIEDDNPFFYDRTLPVSVYM